MTGRAGKWVAVAAALVAFSASARAVEGWAVFANGGKVYRCLAGGSPTQVGTATGVAHACWSADATYVYFIKTNGEIWRMNNNGTTPNKIANGVNTNYCPLAAYRPDPEYVLFVSGSNFYRINGATGAVTQIQSEPRNYVGEVAVNTSGTRMAGRGSNSNLYRITVGGSSSQYATTCSASISPNGSYLTANVSGHTKLTIHKWGGGVYKTLNAPSSHEWDNQKFAVNSNDYVVYNYDTAQRIGYNYVPNDANTVICSMWSSYPDLFIGGLPGAPTPNAAPTASIASPANGTSYSPGDTISYSGSADDPEDGVLGGASLYWELDRVGDGSGPVDTGTGSSGSYTFPTDITSNTEYKLSLTATDSGGLTDTDQISVWVIPAPTNLPPTVDLTASPTSGDAPLTVNFDAGSGDPDGDALTHEWEWDYSGTFSADENTGATETNSHQYTVAGVYTAAVRVSDGQGHTIIDTIGISVSSATSNSPPVIASLTTNPDPPQVLVAASIDFSCVANDPDVDPLTYSWDFGDGNSGSGASTSHSYAASGDYTVEVTVSDGKGGEDRATVVVSVTTPTTLVIECENMTLSDYEVEGSGSFVYIATYISGTATASFPGATESYRMKVVIVEEDDGLPTLDVYVAGTLAGTTDYELGSSSRDPRTVDLGVFSISNGDEIRLEGVLEGGAAARVDKIIFEAEPSGTNRAPTITAPPTADPNPVETGQVVSFTCSATDPDGDTLSYSWDFGDGSAPGSGASVTHSYSLSGDYPVTVTVDDQNGGTDEDTVVVTVNAVGVIVIECEDMSLDGYVVEGSGDFIYIATYAEGTATAQFPGGTGQYRISVNIIKESDGYPTLNVYIGGQLVDTIEYPLGSSQRDPETVELGVFTVANGDEIMIVGTREGDAAARVDYIIFEPLAGGPGDAGPAPFHGVGGGCGHRSGPCPLATIGILTLFLGALRKPRRRAPAHLRPPATGVQSFRRWR